jgi:phospholipid transport system transporter-binding protein
MIKAAPAGQPLILDLSGVIEADSASVALLIDWMRKAKKKNKVLQFSSLPEKMKDIINVSNLEGIM